MKKNTPFQFGDVVLGHRARHFFISSHCGWFWYQSHDRKRVMAADRATTCIFDVKGMVLCTT